MDLHILRSLLLLCSLFLSTAYALNSSPDSKNSLNPHLSAAKAVCTSTPYPNACLDSVKLPISIDILPPTLSFILQSLASALSDALKLSNLFSNIGGNNLVEKHKGAIQDCWELHQITLASLKKSLSCIKAADSRKLADARTFLSAALTNKATCLEGLSSAYGPMLSSLLDSLTSTYAHISNSLSMLSRPGPPWNHHIPNGPPPGFPRRLPGKALWEIQGSDYKYDPSKVITVSVDGTGNFTTISDAINFAPNNSVDRTFIYIRKGMYRENVEIPKTKQNIVLLGDGSGVTVVSGNRSADVWTTFRSATVAVSGDGFLARDITFENTAGADKGQAVALRINADHAAVYKCIITGFQDTLFVHSFRQFYRECDIYGTIDYIFGNAAVVFQGCKIVSRMPQPGQGTVITAQSRASPDENTGISFQNCTILATQELRSNSRTVGSYLGRPWRNYSRVVYMKSYIDGFIEPQGWTDWGDQSLNTLYYGEYKNFGPGSGTKNRVSWRGYHVMDYQDAHNFTVSEFISGQEWLDSTSLPYDDGV